MISKVAKSPSRGSPSPGSLLDELQSTLAHGTVARRVETLRRVTDLFINGAVDYSDKQVGLFDDVFQCLIDHIETSAKMLLANRLAPIDTAPPLTIRAEGDDNLTACIGLRPSVPRHLYLKLLAKASDTVRQRLEAANPQQAAEVPTAVKEATRRARSATSTITKDTAIAHALVKSLY